MGNHSSILAWRITRIEEPKTIVHGGPKESDVTEQLTLSLSNFHCTFFNCNCYYNTVLTLFWTSQVALVVKNLNANAGGVRHAGSALFYKFIQ